MATANAKVQAKAKAKAQAKVQAKAKAKAQANVKSQAKAKVKAKAKAQVPPKGPDPKDKNQANQDAKASRGGAKGWAPTLLQQETAAMLRVVSAVCCQCGT
jgi:hypothetical protein